eukprot:364644-Chlamydomonas_euryale.AAC.19
MPAAHQPTPLACAPRSRHLSVRCMNCAARRPLHGTSSATAPPPGCPPRRRQQHRCHCCPLRRQSPLRCQPLRV